jgi:hypothetical protein
MVVFKQGIELVVQGLFTPFVPIAPVPSDDFSFFIDQDQRGDGFDGISL